MTLTVYARPNMGRWWHCVTRADLAFMDALYRPEWPWLVAEAETVCGKKLSGKVMIWYTVQEDIPPSSRLCGRCSHPAPAPEGDSPCL